MLIIRHAGRERRWLIPAQKPPKLHYNPVGKSNRRSPPVCFSGMLFTILSVFRLSARRGENVRNDGKRKMCTTVKTGLPCALELSFLHKVANPAC